MKDPGKQPARPSAAQQPRVLLRRLRDQHFAGPSNFWVPSPEHATDFRSARDAIIFFHEMRLDDSEVFFFYNDPKLNSAFRLRRATQESDKG